MPFVSKIVFVNLHESWSFQTHFWHLGCEIVWYSSSEVVGTSKCLVWVKNSFRNLLESWKLQNHFGCEIVYIKQHRQSLELQNAFCEKTWNLKNHFGSGIVYNNLHRQSLELQNAFCEKLYFQKSAWIVKASKSFRLWICVY